MRAKRADRLVRQAREPEHADERDEIPPVGEDQIERRGIALAARCVRIEAERFKAIHPDHALAARRQRARILQAAHLGALEIRRLLIDEQHQADALLCLAFQVGKQVCQFEHARDAAAIVVGSGRARHAVIVRADHDHVGVGHVAASMMASILRTRRPRTVNSCGPGV